MSQETKTIIWISVITIIVVVVGFYFWNKSANTTIPPEQTVVDRAKVVAPDSHSIGSIDAKVVVTEFGDYECPACSAAHPVTKALQEKYKDNADVAFVFRHYPLPQHRHAVLSAQFAEAAALQGKFWEMHDKLFETQKAWSPMRTTEDIFLGYAADLGLDVERVKTDVKSADVQARINADKAAADMIGINSTPTFYVNGAKQPGWGLNELSAVIDTALAE